MSKKKPKKKRSKKPAPRKTLATKPVRKSGSTEDVEQWSKHRQYMSDYQRRMYALGPRGRLAALLAKILERIGGYIEKAKKWKITEDEIGLLQEVADLIDMVCEKLEGGGEEDE